MARLTRDEFRATFGQGGAPARRVQDESAPFDFWPYVDAIPAADFEGHDCSAGIVEHVWRVHAGRFEHVTINTESQNVFMVIVLDLEKLCVHGHRLLDLDKEYGIKK